MSKLGEPCKFCLRPITRKVIAQKRAIKVANALASIEKAKANGTKMGRQLVYDPRVKELRSKGLTIRAIAKELGLSTSTVQRCMRV